MDNSSESQNPHTSDSSLFSHIAYIAVNKNFEKNN